MQLKKTQSLYLKVSVVRSRQVSVSQRVRNSFPKYRNYHEELTTSNFSFFGINLAKDTG